MKVEVAIIAKNHFDQIMPGSFPVKDKVRILIDEFTFADFSPNPPKDKPNPVEMTTTFNKAMNYTKRLSYEVGKDGKPVSSTDKAIYEIIEEFYSKHPMTTINGVDHAGTKHAMFDIVDTRKHVITKLRQWDNKRKVANFLVESELSELRNICYFYGVQPADKTKGAICIELSDFENGVLFKSDEKGESRTQDFINRWILGADVDTEFRVNCAKAIQFGIVVNNPKDGRSNYYLGTSFIGISPEDVVAYFKKEQKLYDDFVVRGIKEKDHFSEELSASEAEQEQIKDKSRLGFVDKEMLRNSVMDLYEEIYKVSPGDVVVKKTQITNAGQERLLEYKERLIKQKDALEQKVS